MNPKKHILVVEDVEDIADILKVQLENSGYMVTVINDGEKMLQYIQNDEGKQKIDLCILDRMLPGASGMEICKFLRMFRPTANLPILMLTAMTEPEQIIEGLEAGADDYVTKPFDINILMARVKTLLRRTNQDIQNEDQVIFKMGQLKIDTNQCKAWIAEEELELTLSEYKLLVIFMQQPGKVLTRNQLVEQIQDGPVHVTKRTIDTHIFGLRKKLKDHAKLVETVRGIGYRGMLLK